MLGTEPAYVRSGILASCAEEARGLTRRCRRPGAAWPACGIGQPSAGRLEVATRLASGRGIMVRARPRVSRKPFGGRRTMSADLERD
jgi:hypothetical protein